MNAIQTATVPADLVAEGRAAAATGRGRAIRRAARLSMNDVAHDLGVSIDAVQRWETHGGLPRAAEAARYALLLRRLDAFGMKRVDTRGRRPA